MSSLYPVLPPLLSLYDDHYRMSNTIVSNFGEQLQIRARARFRVRVRITVYLKLFTEI